MAVCRVRASCATQEALEPGRKAVGIRPKIPQALSMYSALLLSFRRNEEALRILDEAIELQPANVMSLINRGIALMADGWRDDAAESFAQALAVNPLHFDGQQTHAHGCGRAVPTGLLTRRSPASSYSYRPSPASAFPRMEKALRLPWRPPRVPVQRESTTASC